MIAPLSSSDDLHAEASAPPTPPADLILEETRPALVDLGPPPTAAARIAAHLEAAIAGHDPAENTVLGLRIVILSLHTLARAPAADIERLMGLLGQVAPIVAKDVGRRLAPEAVHLGCAAAAGLIGNSLRQPGQHEPAALLDARLQHTALAADEIDAVVRRRLIEAGGDQLRRTYRLVVARDAVPTGALH